MKKNKVKFFPNEKNTLNKGYGEKNNSLFNAKIRSIDNSDLFSVLPNIEVMYEYESMYPGSIKEVFDILKKAQDNHLYLERKKISGKTKIRFITSIAAVLICTMICVTSTVMFYLGFNKFAFYFVLVSLSFMLLLFALNSFKEYRCNAIKWSNNVKSHKKFHNKKKVKFN